MDCREALCYKQNIHAAHNVTAQRERDERMQSTRDLVGQSTNLFCAEEHTVYVSIFGFMSLDSCF